MGSRQVCKENDICPSVWAAGKAGTKARRHEAVRPIHGTAILSLKADRAVGVFRGERIRSWGSGVPSSRTWPLS